ncbi:MAG: SCO family protein [Chloroflexi bacterium]|nr:SCO family protein [Chloroflexota bacterium]
MTVQPSKGKTTTYVLLALVLLTIAAIIYVVYRSVSRPAEPVVPAISETQYTGTEYDPPVQLSAFTMPGSRGGPISLSDLNGKWSLVFFGYTHCPDFCPLTLAEFKQVKQALGEQADEVQFVFISVDGQRDTADALRDYLARFDPAFIGLSGDDETLARIGPEYGLFYERRADTGSQANYLVDHTTRTYLVDPNGLLRVTYAYGTEPDIIAESIRQQMEKVKT